MTTIKKSKTKEPINADLTLVIKGDYKDFKNFYDTNKQTIYENIVDLFNLILTDNKEPASLVVFYDIEKQTFHTEFTFKKSDKEMLKSVFLPYFTEIEEYETCTKVSNIYKGLSD